MAKMLKKWICYCFVNSAFIVQKVIYRKHPVDISQKSFSSGFYNQVFLTKHREQIVPSSVRGGVILFHKGMKYFASW